MDDLEALPSGDRSLEDAKAWLRERINEGEHCPCCTQFAKVYRRKLTSSMARALISFYRTAQTDWFNIHEVPLRHGEYGQLRWWGLIEPQMIGAPENKRVRTGWWRVTEKGRDFVSGHITVEKYVRVYNNRLLGVDGEPTTIRDALGDKFDYDELMSTSGAPGPHHRTEDERG